MTKHNVTGGWVDIRDPQDVPERLRRKITNLSVQGAPLIAQLEGKEMPDVTDIEFIESFNDNLAMALVANWSFDKPITGEGLLDLPGPVYDEIQKLCVPLVQQLMPNFGVDPDPKVTTAPLSELNQP
jgi:hypothetical protein